MELFQATIKNIIETFIKVGEKVEENHEGEPYIKYKITINDSGHDTNIYILNSNNIYSFFVENMMTGVCDSNYENILCYNLTFFNALIIHLLFVLNINDTFMLNTTTILKYNNSINVYFNSPISDSEFIFNEKQKSNTLYNDEHYNLLTEINNIAIVKSLRVSERAILIDVSEDDGNLIHVIMNLVKLIIC